MPSTKAYGVPALAPIDSLADWLAMRRRLLLTVFMNQKQRHTRAASSTKRCVLLENDW